MAPSTPGLASKFEEVFTTSSKQTIIVVLVIAALLILVMVVIYIVSLFNNSRLQSKELQTYLINLNDPKVVPFKIDAGAMSTVDVGKEFTYSFWLYLDGNYDVTTNHKLIFQRGNSPEQQKVGNWSKSSNPIIFMDKATNRMYVALSTSAVVLSSSSSGITYNDILARDEQGRYKSGWLVSSIDYVPLQRWVNVMVVVKESAMFLYLDGDMYSAISVTDMPSTSRPLIQGCSGDAYIGDSRSKTAAAMSKTQYFNYALTQREIKGIYSSGPYTQTLLGYLGIGNYGMRSPVYEINADAL